jgi:hypothetical protein
MQVDVQVYKVSGVAAPKQPPTAPIVTSLQPTCAVATGTITVTV